MPLPIEEARGFLPEVPQLKNSFQKLNAETPATFTILEDGLFHKLPEDAQNAVLNYAVTGILAINTFSKDEDTKALTSQMLYSLENEQFRIIPTIDIAEEAFSRGVPYDVAQQNTRGNDEPHILSKYGGLTHEIEGAEILITTEFIDIARKQPLKTLSMLVWTSQKAADTLNLFLLEHPEYVNPHAEAAEAQFLNSLKLSPKEIKKMGSYYERIMKRYPKGIHSLPREIRQLLGIPS